MSPAALALAVGLHGLVAAALWWASPARLLDHAETPIMISIEPEPLSAGAVAASPSPVTDPATPESVSPEPVSPEPAQSEPEPADQAVVEAQPTPEPLQQQAALAPAEPAPAEATRAEPAPVERAATPPRLQETEPAPPETPAVPAAPAEAEAEAAWHTDASSWKPQVTVERSLAAPPPAPRPARPAPRPSTAPRTAQTPGMRLQDYPPQTSSLGGPSSSSFDQSMGDGGARNDYLSRVYRHVDPHRDYPAAARAARQHGRVVTRVTINRSGELLDIRLDRSSGWPLIDNAEIAAIRRAMPLPPVPDGMRGDPVVLVLPMNY